MKTQNRRINPFESPVIFASYNCYFCVFSWISFALALLSYVNVQNILNWDEVQPDIIINKFPQFYSDWQEYPITSVSVELESCPAGSVSLIQFPFSESPLGCSCAEGNYGFECTATMLKKGCKLIQSGPEQILMKWPFEDKKNQFTNALLCGKTTRLPFESYSPICNDTFTKQCGIHLCMSKDEECPLKDIQFALGGEGIQINDKWTLRQIGMNGNTDPSYPFLTFRAAYCSQCSPPEASFREFYSANASPLPFSTAKMNLEQSYFMRLENKCSKLDLRSGLWDVEEIQLFACVSCGAFAGLFGGLVLLVTTCSLAGCDLECLILGNKHPSYVGIIKIWLFTKCVGEIVTVIAIICSFCTQTEFLWSAQDFIDASCSSQNELDSLEEFKRHYKKYVYYFTMVDLILFVGTTAIDLALGYGILLSKTETTEICEIKTAGKDQSEQKVKLNGLQTMQGPPSESERLGMVSRGIQYEELYAVAGVAIDNNHVNMIA